MPSRSDAGEALVLEHFLPYRLSVLSSRISRRLSALYAERFDMSIAEWRVLAVVASYPDSSAEAVCRRTEMDKVAVSRAVGRLLQRKHLLRRYDAADRRRSQLRLSARGQRVYRRIVPLARRFEQDLLAALNARERAVFHSLLQKLDAVC